MFKSKRSVQRFRPFKSVTKKPAIFVNTTKRPQLIYTLINYMFLSKLRFSCFSVPNSFKTATPVNTLKKGDLFCNCLVSGRTIASSPNTYAKKISTGIRMPSGSLYKSTAIFLASNFLKKKTTVITNKSSTFFFKKKRLSVRGVAKNAVDHKHGGKGRGGVLRGF